MKTAEPFRKISRRLIQKNGRRTIEYKWHIFIANLDPVIGSEQGKVRPVLVISEEEINHILPVVNVLPITSRKPGRKIYPNEVLIPAEIGFLEHYFVKKLSGAFFLKAFGFNFKIAIGKFFVL